MTGRTRRVFDSGIMIISILADETLSEPLVVTGYTRDKISYIDNVIKNVTHLTVVCNEERGHKTTATLELNKQVDIADKAYMQILKLARIAFGEDMLAVEELDLSARRKNKVSAWYNQADLFYQSLLSRSEFIKKIAELGLSKEVIEKGYQSLKDVSLAIVTQKQKNAQSLLATANRDAELQKMDKLISELKKVCRVIFEGDKMSLFKLGL